MKFINDEGKRKEIGTKPLDIKQRRSKVRLKQCFTSDDEGVTIRKRNCKVKIQKSAEEQRNKRKSAIDWDTL